MSLELALLSAMMRANQIGPVISIAPMRNVIDTTRAFMLLGQLRNAWSSASDERNAPSKLAEQATKIKDITEHCEKILHELDAAHSVQEVHTVAALHSAWMHKKMRSRRKHIGKCVNLVARLVGLKLASLPKDAAAATAAADAVPGALVELAVPEEAAAKEKPSRVPDEDGEERPAGDAKRVRVVMDDDE